MAENVILGGIVAHSIRQRFALGFKERVQQASVKLFNDRIAHVGKKISHIEREFSARAKQVIRQRIQFCILQTKDNNQIGVFTPVPYQAVLGFIGISEFDRIMELNQIKSTFTKLQGQLLFAQQAIRIGNQCQLADVGYKIF